MRYYPPFRAVIPHFGAGHLRVTQPSATNDSSKPESSVRLACLMHAASVDPEPGSNSPNEIAQPCGCDFVRGFDRSHIRFLDLCHSSVVKVQGVPGAKSRSAQNPK